MIDPNILLAGYVPPLPTLAEQQSNTLKQQGQATNNQVADQTLQQQKIVTENAQRAQQAQKLYNDLLMKYTVRADSSQGGAETTPAVPTGAPASSLAATSQPAPDGSATVGTDAFGNVIPRVGVESPSGEPQPSSMQPSSTLAAAAALPGVETAGPAPAPYQEPAAAAAQSTPPNSLQGSASGAVPAVPGANSLSATAAVPSAASATGAQPTNSVATKAPSATSSTAPPAAPNFSGQVTYGGMTTDFGAIDKEMTAAGFGTDALQHDQERVKQFTAAMQAQEAQLKATAERMKGLGSLAGTIPWVTNWNAGDPVAQTQIANAQQGAINAVKQAMAYGYLEPHHGTALLQEIAKGYTQGVQQELQQAAAAGMNSYQQYKAAADKTKAYMDSRLKDAQTGGAQATTETKQRQNAAARMSQADTPQQWAQQYNALPENMKPYFDDPAHFNADTSPQKAMLAGMSEQGMGNFMNQQSRIEASKDQRDMMNQFRGEQLSIERMNATDRQANRQTQGKADLRQTRDELFKLQNQERSLYDVRTDLQSSISSNGKTYVDKSGKTMPMSTATKQTGESDQALLQQMKDRYNQVTNDVIGVVGQKNGLLIGSGANPQVTTDKARAALTTGDSFWSTLNKKKETMGPPLPPVGAQQSGPAVPATPAPKPVTAAPPPTANPAHNATGGPVAIKIPGGKIKYFPNQKALEAFAAEAGLTLK